ncbi:MAG: DUF3618 domain-containing protein [Acidobacteriia bacterium]|nr:DUF3618 domain-containing protein [Terriglobia bacterium]
MGTTTDAIRQEIEQARSRLGQNLNELEYKVKREADWHVQYDRRPWVFLGAAFGLSALIGMLVTRRAV